MTAYSLDTPSTFGHHHHHHTHHHPHGPYTHSHNTIANPQMTGTQWGHLAAAAHHLNYSPMTASPAAQHMAAVAAAAAAAAAAAGGNPTVNPASSANGGNPLVNLAPIDVDTTSPTPPNEPSMNGNSHASPLIPYDEWMATVSNSYVLNSQRNGSLHVAPQRTNSNDSSLCTDIDSSPSSMMGYTGDNIGRVNRHPFEWMRTPQNNASRTKRIGRTRTKDKYRSVYTDHQRLELEKEFHYNVYIDVVRKAELAQELGLSQRQIKIWFQNRRAKDRKLRQRQATRDVSVKLEPKDSLLLSSSLPSPQDSPRSRNSCDESVIV
ncbi:CDX-1 isoform X1 [Octopus vulgaris]|uniref:CDX-1 isoform X1 n=1 Tax=Octopus vulgaris TaxID=6645 RepID=A0AA36FA96_OCTVU|nr:CDX-1 isoform X1 [Octopus vulgaris]